VDVKGTVNLILLAPSYVDPNYSLVRHLRLHSCSYIVLVDNIMGIQVLTYEGRLVSNPRVPGLNPVFLKRGAGLDLLLAHLLNSCVLKETLLRATIVSPLSIASTILVSLTSSCFRHIFSWLARDHRSRPRDWTAYGRLQA